MVNLTAHSDEELLALLKEGQEGAFDILYQRHWHSLYQIAFKRLKDRAQCSDIVQDVFTDLWQNRETKNIGTLLPYLHTAVRYKIYTLLSKDKAAPAFVEPFENMAISPFTADGPFGEREMKQLLEAWLQTLPEKRRQIFELRYMEGKSSKEISEILHISQKTVQNQLHTASNNLRSVIMKVSVLGIVIFF